MTTLEQFADIIGVDLLARRYAGQDGRWTVSLADTEVKDGGCLVSAYGNDASVSAARLGYCVQIAGRRIVINAGADNRREFNVPKDLQ